MIIRFVQYAYGIIKNTEPTRNTSAGKLAPKYGYWNQFAK